MRYTTLFSIILLILLSGCGKDKFGTTPSLKFKNVNTTELHSGQMLTFTLSYTDAEGDITDSVFIEKIVPNCAASDFQDGHPVPNFPTTKNQSGDLTITYGYNSPDPSYPSVAPQCQKNDTAVFRFALRDKANHTSDTVSSPPIVIVHQ